MVYTYRFEKGYIPVSCIRKIFFVVSNLNKYSFKTILSKCHSNIIIKKIKRNVVAFVLYLPGENEKASFKTGSYRHDSVYTLRVALRYCTADAHLFTSCRIWLLNRSIVWMGYDIIGLTAGCILYFYGLFQNASTAFASFTAFGGLCHDNTGPYLSSRLGRGYCSTGRGAYNRSGSFFELQICR